VRKKLQGKQRHGRPGNAPAGMGPYLPLPPSLLEVLPPVPEPPLMPAPLPALAPVDSPERPQPVISTADTSTTMVMFFIAVPLSVGSENETRASI
jgi:hypothetical protein